MSGVRTRGGEASVPFRLAAARAHVVNLPLEVAPDASAADEVAANRDGQEHPDDHDTEDEDECGDVQQAFETPSVGTPPCRRRASSVSSHAGEKPNTFRHWRSGRGGRV